MSDYRSTTSMSQIADRLGRATRVLITTHSKPDGDAMGSVLALQRGLTQLGKSASIHLAGPFEANLLRIAEPTSWSDLARGLPGSDFDTAVVADTGALPQLDPIGPWLKTHRDIIVGIDHHARGDDIAPMRWIEPKAVSTTAMLAPLLDAMGVTITGEVGGIGEALFMGLATDSGWFRFGNAGAEAFALAAGLLERGVDKSRLYQILEETHRPERLALEARALGSLEYHLNGATALQTLRAEDFRQTGGLPEDLTGVVNLPMIVGSVRVSILISQSPASASAEGSAKPNPVKVSFRSKPAPPDGDADDFIDVNRLAAEFGGGGHVHAAGAKINAPIERARELVVEAVRRLGSSA